MSVEVDEAEVEETGFEEAVATTIAGDAPGVVLDGPDIEDGDLVFGAGVADDEGQWSDRGDARLLAEEGSPFPVAFDFTLRSRRWAVSESSSEAEASSSRTSGEPGASVVTSAVTKLEEDSACVAVEAVSSCSGSLSDKEGGTEGDTCTVRIGTGDNTCTVRSATGADTLTVPAGSDFTVRPERRVGSVPVAVASVLPSVHPVTTSAAVVRAEPRRSSTHSLDNGGGALVSRCRTSSGTFVTVKVSPSTFTREVVPAGLGVTTIDVLGDVGEDGDKGTESVATDISKIVYLSENKSTTKKDNQRGQSQTFLSERNERRLNKIDID